MKKDNSQMGSFRPRAYLSFSQMTTFEMSPEKYADIYFYGEKQRTSRNMHYGSMFAEGLESGELTGDPILDLVMARMPKLDRRDMPVEDPNGTEVWYERDKRMVRVPVLTNLSDDIPLLAVPDTASSDYSAFKEYKTSVRKWTQKMADDSGQITFYATAIWIVTKKVPQDIELVNACVQYDQEENGRLVPTGEILRFPTTRNLTDVIKMTARIRRAWAGIQKLYEEKLL